MPSRTHTRRCASGLIALSIALCATASADAAEIGADGGITLTVSFETTPDIDSSVMPPLGDPGAEAHYCAAMEQFSEELYELTEGAHYIERVRFYEQTQYSDIRWRYLTDEDDYTFSYGSFNDWIQLNERGTTDADPYTSPPHSINSLGWLLNHEFGHFFYGLSDEYIYRDAGGGRTGFCADGSYGISFDEDGDMIGEGTTCDEEALQCGGSPCVFFGQCISGEAAVGKECVADLVDPFDPPDYGGGCGGGTCLGSDEERSDVPEKKRICLSETDLSLDTGDEELGVCIMAGGGMRDRWCDGNHVHTWNDNQLYGVNVDFDLGYMVGPSDGSDGGKAWANHSCWDQAADLHIDLAGVHTQGTYPSLAAIIADAGPVPPVDCQWSVDGAGEGAHALLLVDRSGSMAYTDEGGADALDLATDAALYFYNETDNGDFVGVSVYNNVVGHAQFGGSDLVFEEKTGDIVWIDGGITATGSTDIANAFNEAHAEVLAAGAPEANRNIVLFSDGQDNGGGDPFAEAQQACDDGITVHTIAYGDADSDALAQMDCSGQNWVTGTVESNGIGFETPDPVEIKSAIARIQHYISNEDELVEKIDDLEPLAVSTVEEVKFLVPEETPAMTFSWLANHECVWVFDVFTQCKPLFNLLERVELEAPDGTTVAAGLSLDEENGLYRTVTVREPQAGIWKARIDKTEPAGANVVPGEWEAKLPSTRVAWVGFVDHPSLEANAWTSPRRGPVDRPIGIRARMVYRSLATNISVNAEVTHAGSSWNIPMFDDGLHGDDERRDGIYGGWFNPDGTWDVENGNYRVKVRMFSEQGLAMGVGHGDTDETEIEAKPILRPGTAWIEAETSFRISGRYTTKRDGGANPGSFGFVCPDLERGVTSFLTADVIGLAANEHNARVSLGGDIEIENLTFACQNCDATQSDPITRITFNATPNADATLGNRPLRVQTGDEILESTQLCRICASGACDEIELAVEPFTATAPSVLSVSGAMAGETVHFAGSRAGLGTGPCPFALGGLCLDLGLPALQLGTAVVDDLGQAILEVTVPDQPGAELGLQAAVARGVGGAESVKSNAILQPIDP